MDRERGIKTYNDLPKKHRKLFKKMFDMVGCDIKSFDFGMEDWYYAHAWDVETEKKYKDWLIEVFKKPPYNLADKWAQNEAAYFLLNWGWATEPKSGRVGEWHKTHDYKPKYTLIFKIRMFIINLINK